MVGKRGRDKVRYRKVYWFLVVDVGNYVMVSCDDVGYDGSVYCSGVFISSGC